MLTKINFTLRKKIALSSLLLVTGIFLYFVYLTPKKVTSYMGINLGDSMAEVTYALGTPDDADDADTWAYRNENRTIAIQFDENQKVNLIICYIDEEKGIKTSGECKVNDIGTKDSEETVLKKLGTPNSTEITKDGSKQMYYNKLNMLIFLKKKSVWGLAIGKEV